MTNPISNLIAEKGWCVADGATGSNFFGRGLEAGYPPELWCVERPDEVIRLHAAFLSAGADLILTNSFGANAPRLKLHKSENRVYEINKAAAGLAREAIDRHAKVTGRCALVAGSMGPTGELFVPMGELIYAQAVEFFAEQAEALAAGGVDVLWIETMSSTEEVAAATEAAKGTGLPVVATLTFDTARRSMMGVTPTAFAAFALEIGLDVLGSNCGIGPAELMDSTTELCAADCGLPIVAKGNCGIPQYINGEIHFHGSPELMAHYALHARDAGATVIGGCCGTTPEHLAAMVDALNSTPPRPFDPEVMTEQLGKPWPDLSSRGVDGGGRRSRRRQG
jgi:5-methyltetrahydrofolate--homocysteine methyltransferase